MTLIHPVVCLSRWVLMVAGQPECRACRSSPDQPCSQRDESDQDTCSDLKQCDKSHSLTERFIARNCPRRLAQCVSRNEHTEKRLASRTEEPRKAADEDETASDDESVLDVVAHQWCFQWILIIYRERCRSTTASARHQRVVSNPVVFAGQSGVIRPISPKRHDAVSDVVATNKALRLPPEGLNSIKIGAIGGSSNPTRRFSLTRWSS